MRRVSGHTRSLPIVPSARSRRRYPAPVRPFGDLSTAGATGLKSSEGRTMTALERGGPAAGNGQHYESFIVRVLLNDDGSIRDTRMEHIGTGEVKRWADWEHDAMLGFIKEAAGPTAPPVLLAAPVGPLDAEPHPESVPESVAEPSATSQVRPISQPPVTARAAPTTPSPLAQPEASQATAGSRGRGRLAARAPRTDRSVATGSHAAPHGAAFRGDPESGPDQTGTTKRPAHVQRGDRSQATRRKIRRDPRQSARIAESSGHHNHHD